MTKIKDYADLFTLNGAWRKKRAEKKHYCTDKSMKTRDANLRNYIIPLWGEYYVKKLTTQNIEDGIAGLAGRFSGKVLAGSTINRVLSVLSDFY